MHVHEKTLALLRPWEGKGREALQRGLTSTRAPLLMLRGVLRVDCMVMRPLEALSAPLAAAKLLGIAEALALVLTPADSLRRILSVSNTPTAQL